MVSVQMLSDMRLRKCGYDLRELVDEDIRKNPKDYDIDEPDKNY